MKLRSLVLTRLIPAFALLLILMGIAGLVLIRSSVNQNYLVSLNTTLVTVKAQLDTVRYKARSTGRQLLMSEPLIQYTAAPPGFYRDLALEPRVLAMLQDTANAFPALESISLVTGDNRLLLQVSETFDPTVDSLPNHGGILADMQVTESEYHENFHLDDDRTLIKFTFAYGDSLTHEHAANYLVLEFNLDDIAATARQLWLESGLALSIVDSAGEMMLAAGRRGELAEALAAVHRELIPDQSPHEFQFGRSKYSYLALPVGSATMVSLVPNSVINNKGSQFATLTLVLTGLLILLGILLVTLFIDRLVVDPVSRLTDSIRKRTNGEGKPLAEKFSVDEIHELAETFDRVFEAEQQARSQIQRLAYFDTLTGLANRRLFISHLSRLVAASRRNSQRLAVLFIDLDNFKFINDHYGHHFGDKVLVEFSERIRQSTRESDLLAVGSDNDEDHQSVARLAGDEFAVLLTDLSDNMDAGRVAERILGRLGQPFRLGETSIQVGASIGIALYPEDASSGQQLIQYADAAMYQAKMNGRGSHAYFSKELSRTRERQVEIQEALRSALHKDEFELVFLPYVNAGEHRICGAEILLRWHRSNREQVTPAEFIPIAESCGLMKEIDAWVIDKAMEILESWQFQQLPPINLAINISAVELRNRHFPGQLIEQLRRYAIDPSRLELEVAESKLANPDGRVLEILQQIRNSGVKLVLDDFGTGFTSMNQLQSLPADRLKIDRHHVSSVAIDGRRVQIADVILMLSRAHGISTTAEGVETLAHVKYLEAAGCDYLQGYYFSRPLTLDQLESLLRERRLLLTGSEDLQKDRELPPALSTA